MISQLLSALGSYHQQIAARDAAIIGSYIRVLAAEQKKQKTIRESQIKRHGFKWYARHVPLIHNDRT